MITAFYTKQKKKNFSQNKRLEEYCPHINNPSLSKNKKKKTICICLSISNACLTFLECGFVLLNVFNK